MSYLGRLWSEAKRTLTAYLALAVAALSQLAEHSEDLYNQVPALKTFLPPSHALEKGSHYLLTVLGFAIVWSRVRRLLRS